MSLDRKKLALVHVAKKRLGLDDGAYRSVLERAGGVASSRDLKDDGFNRVMAEFGRMGFETDYARDNFGANRHPFMATPAQVGYIKRLWADYTDGAGTDQGLDKWIERTFKIGALRFLEGPAAGKAIAALIAMNANRKKAAKTRSEAAHV